MPSTARHSYFNISNSNYKSLIEPQRLVEITAWNRVQTTESAAIDHCWHWCDEGKKINKLLKIANNFKVTDNRGFFDIPEWKQEELEWNKAIPAMKMMPNGSEVY